MKLRILIVLSWVSCFCVISFASTSHESSLPSIGELERVHFAPVGISGVSVPYADVVGVKRLFLAYEASSQAISRYHDSILTRGIRGQAVFKTVSSAVVAVVVGHLDSNDHFDPDYFGAGAIVDPRGYILTNWHVINGYLAALIFLKPAAGASLENAPAFGAKVIYQDSTTDLALLKMLDPPNALPVLQLGDIDKVQVAEDIHIIGHPHGNFWSYSTGVVSQVRDAYTWHYSDGSSHSAKVLQLQTAINTGNSGGPVVDDSGNILGLVAMSEEGQNLDWAIAADVIKKFLLVGMQMTTRSAQPSASSPPPQQLLSGRLSDGKSVWKAIYPDCVTYVIGGVGLIAKFHDDAIVSGWDSNAEGQFASWAADLPDGKHIVGNASDGLFRSVSQTQTPSSLTH